MPSPASNVSMEDGDPAEVSRLIQRVKTGDEAAFGALMELYHARVYGLLVGMVRNPDDAKDCAQQVWIKVWNKLHTFKGDAGFYTWLYRLATYVGLDFIRKRNRKKEVNLSDEMEPPRASDSDVPGSVRGEPDAILEKREISEVFNKALATLSPELRTALTLREVEGLSYDEIANAMRCRKGTVMSRIFYARKQIQTAMKEWR